MGGNAAVKAQIVSLADYGTSGFAGDSYKEISITTGNDDADVRKIGFGSSTSGLYGVFDTIQGNSSDDVDY